MGSHHEAADPPYFGHTTNTPTLQPVRLRKKANSNSSSVLIKKLFSRQPSPLKPVAEGTDGKTDDDLSEFGVEMTYDDLNVMPCPYIRLAKGQKLEPRVETMAVSIRKPKSNPHITTPSIDGQSSLTTNSIISLPEIQGFTPLDMDGVARDLINQRSSQLCEAIATAAAADPSHVDDWISYVKYYAEGRYNLLMPPPPPSMNSEFKYLPAMYPTNEPERLAILQMCDITWSEWAVDRARSLVSDAMNKFSTPWAAISFFDRDLEIIKAERGYKRHIIPRSESIAAHVLMANEVMAVLDTQMDWRFAGNPLVAGNTKIRFFAGAPLLSPNGEVVGVFAIFSPRPRRVFTAAQRRELSDYSAVAMADLAYLMEPPVDESCRTTPILERRSLINRSSSIDRSSVTKKCNKDTSLDAGLIPPALRYHKGSGNQKARSRLVIDAQDVLSNPSEHTPPASDDSDNGLSPAISKGFGKNLKQLSVSAQPSFGSLPDMMTPESPVFGYIPPRAFSGSDLTSVDQNPPCTPEPWCVNSPDVSALTGGDMSSGTLLQGASTLLNQHPNTPDSIFCRVAGFDVESVGYSRALHDDAERLGAEIDASFAQGHVSLEVMAPHSQQSKHGVGNSPTLSVKKQTSIGSISTDISSERLSVANPQVEAEFAAALWAQKLGFDIIYVVELIPRNPFATDEELNAPGGMKFRMVVSHGVDGTVNFNVDIHLSVIRASGDARAITWDNKASEPGDFSKGFMMCLNSDKAVAKNRSRGVVFGAFRKTPEDFEIEQPRMTVAEIECLQEVGLLIKNILFKPKHKGRKRCDTEPSSTPESYPANEAIEIGKYSLDAGSKRVAIPEEAPNRYIQLP